MEHGSNLGNRDVGFIDYQQEVFGEIVEEGVGRATGSAPINMAGIVFNAGAGANLPHHFQVIGGAHLQALFF